MKFERCVLGSCGLFFALALVVAPAARAVSLGSDPGAAFRASAPSRVTVNPDGEWGQLAPSPNIDTDRSAQAAVYDPVRHRMLIVGGSNSTGYLADTWALSLDGPSQWIRLGTTGSPPTLYDHSAIYDPLRDRLLVFGGGTGNAVWALSLTGTPNWTQLAVTGTPPVARFSHTAIYDPVRDRMIIYGGIDQLSCNPGALPFGDVWALSLSGTPAWTKLAPAGTPPTARLDQTAIYDPIRDRMVVYGGLTGGFCWCDCGTLFNDTWALSLDGAPAWSLITASGPTNTAGRYAHSAIYDATRDRMIIFGGTSLNYGHQTLNDTWALPLGEGGSWSPLAPGGVAPDWRVNHTAIYDPQNDRMVVFAGQTPAFTRDAWSLYMNSAVLSAEPPGSRDLLITDVHPNPVGRELTVGFSLTGARPALLELIDIQGRRVAAREVGSLGVGSHLVRLGDVSRIPAGLYLVRLTQDGHAVMAKAAVVH